MDTRPVGVFDSGVGGLSALREIRNRLPDEDLIYFGDTARIPYGTRSAETIVEYALQDMNFLISKGVKAIAVACGTVSAIALDTLRSKSSVPIIGVIEPAVDKALELSRNRKIGVFGTSATVKSEAYLCRIRELDGGVEVSQKACPLLVPLIENGYIGKDCEITRMALREYLEPIKKLGADTLILGCTHYPLIKELILSEWGEGEAVDTGYELATALEGLLRERGLLHEGGRLGKVEIYSSDDLSSQAEMFLPGELCHTARFTGRIPIEEYK